MLKNRFLSVFALAFAAGIATPLLAQSGWEAVVFILFLALALVFVGVYVAVHFMAKDAKKIIVYPMVVAIGLALGAGWLCLRAMPYDGYDSYVGVRDTVKGVVTENGSSAESKYLEIRVENSRVSLPSGTKIRLYCQKNEVVLVGDVVTAEVTYSSLSRSSERASSACLVANGYVSAKEQGKGILASVRYALGENCTALYESYDCVGVAQALTLRERSLLTPQTNEAYRNAGLSHLLAISGLHLSVLVAMLRKLLFAFRFRKGVRETVALAVILLYCFLTGFSPSIVRAAVMVGLVLVGEMVLRETDGLTLLSLALLILLAVNPYALLSVSLQLSFLSCLGIILLEPHVTTLQRKIKGGGNVKFGRLRALAAGAVSLFLTSCSAVVFTFPVIAYTFGSLSWLSPFTNLVFVPLFTPILMLLLLSVLLYSFLPVLGTALAFLPGYVLGLMESLFRWLREQNVGTMYISDSWVLIPVLLSCAAIACMLLFRKKGVLLFACFSLSAVMSLPVCALVEAAVSPEEYILFSPEESFLFVSCDGAGVLLDFGTDHEDIDLSEEYTITEYVLTVADDMALDRLCNVLGKQPVTRVYLPLFGEDGERNDLSEYFIVGEAFGCEVISYRYGMEIALLSYSASERTAVTPFGVSVLLGEEGQALSDTYIWALSPDVKEYSLLSCERLYLPKETDFSESVAGHQVYFYTTHIVYKDGEVIIP